MSEAENLQFIKGIYDALITKGDPGPFFEALADDAVLRITIPSDTPLGREFKGKEDLQRYFVELDRVFALEKITIDEYIARGDKVTLLGFESGTVKLNGKTLVSEWAGVFTVADGKISSVLFIEDTSELTAAYRGH
ncbi:nuclear transport factor 2 family protein [Chondromyces crocatus]|uniref:SnoaL-like domain-containing protein n=1 Tax=Chondromyces crocatus TaxID=52 RepID=A0A0K1EPY0_CHOCO|nr:nuclear transport factor 2 family protein [Chondromyces crocatus]AKT42874.1 uncharacterized protein CMC5_071020 [Chondromyces crocatus]